MEHTPLIAISTDGTEVKVACELSLTEDGRAVFAQQPLKPETHDDCLLVIRCALEMLTSLPSTVGEINGYTIWAHHHVRTAVASLREACDGIPQV